MVSCRGRMRPVFVDREVATRLERAEADLTRRYVDAYSRLCPEVGAASREVAGGCVSFAGMDSPLSRADAGGLSGPAAPKDLDAIEEFLESRGANSTIETCAFTDQSVFDFAGRRGYRIGHILNVFALPLSPQSRPDRGTTALGTGSEVRPLSKSTADSDLWCNTVGRGFASIEDGDVPYMDIYRGIFHAVGTIGYLATVDGVPVGAGALKIAGQVAYLSTASTLPPYRRKGIQSALLMHRLSDAITQGCDLAAIVTSPGSDSERNVLRVGFALAYARIRLVKRR